MNNDRHLAYENKSYCKKPILVQSVHLTNLSPPLPLLLGVHQGAHHLSGHSQHTGQGLNRSFGKIKHKILLSCIPSFMFYFYVSLCAFNFGRGKVYI